MEDVGDLVFQTSNQQSNYCSTSDVLLDTTSSNYIGHELEVNANFDTGGEEDDNSIEEVQLGTVVPEHETSNQQSNYCSTSDVLLDTTSSNYIGHELEVNANFDTSGEEDDNSIEEVQLGTVVPEHAIRIDVNERQTPVIINGSGWSTLKVPAPMFKVDKGAYVPKIVSIGPFHHNEPSLRAMQTQKWQFLNRLIRNQTEQPNLEESLKNAMRGLEERTREFYGDDFQAVEPDDFVQMMLLDGCFIVELLRFYEKNREGEPLFKTRWTWTSISRDLLLLENQLPMFVLQKIFELTTFKGEASLITLVLRYIEPLRPGRHKFATHLLNMEANGMNYIHLLDLFHSALTSGDNVYSEQPVKSEKKETRDLMLPGKGWVHNAKTLCYAGVKFETNSCSILDIKLKGKTLKIPTITIDDSTGPLLRNLIAYEQNSRDAAPYFCCLAVFLDSIVDTVEDVRILRAARIIKQAKGGDQEVVHLFNSLTKELVFDIDEDDCYMIKQIEKINRLCLVHDTRVRIRRLLARLSYNGVLKTLFYTVAVTIILFYITTNN